MEIFKDLFKKKNTPQLILSILLIIFLITNTNLPQPINQLLDNDFSKVVIALISLLLFVYANPILGILGLFVAYKIISQNSLLNIDLLENTQSCPTEEKKWSPFNTTNQFSYTLEQEMVSKMTTNKETINFVNSSFEP